MGDFPWLRKANFQDLPLCKQDLDQAAEDMTTQFHLAQPSCKRGAVMLQAAKLGAPVTVAIWKFDGNSP